MEDKVKILMATYNGAKYVREQIESILNQSFTNWELVICDDGSTDNTVEILNEYVERYDGKISMIPSKRTGNARDNFLYLLSVCEGEYFMFCDQDDVWESTKVYDTYLEMKKAEIEKTAKEPIMIFTDLKVVDENLNVLNGSFMEYQSINPSRLKLNELIIQNVVTGCTMMINSALKEMSMKFNNSTNIIMHDWWIALVAAKFGTIKYVNKQLINYRQHSNNSVGAKDSKSLGYYLERVKNVDKVKKSLDMTRKQAGEFKSTYEKFLKKEELDLFVGYENINKLNKIKRVHFYFKYKVLKSRAIQNLGLIIWG